MLSDSIFPDLGIHRWMPPDASAHRRERASASSHCIARHVSCVCQAWDKFMVLPMVAPVAMSVTVKWLCSWRARVVASCERARFTVVVVKTRTSLAGHCRLDAAVGVIVRVGRNLS